MTNILDEFLEVNEDLSDIDKRSVDADTDYDPDILSLVAIRNTSRGGMPGQCRSYTLFPLS